MSLHTCGLCYYTVHHESPEPKLTNYGRIVDSVIQNIPAHLQITVDRYVIMPNHVHLIVMVSEENKSPTQSRSVISKAVGYIKMNASKAIRQRFGDVTVWQRGYHDHVIRNREDYQMIAQYIAENPLRWELDVLFSEE